MRGGSAGTDPPLFLLRQALSTERSEDINAIEIVGTPAVTVIWRTHLTAYSTASPTLHATRFLETSPGQLSRPHFLESNEEYRCKENVEQEKRG